MIAGLEVGAEAGLGVDTSASAEVVLVLGPNEEGPEVASKGDVRGSA